MPTSLCIRFTGTITKGVWLKMFFVAGEKLYLRGGLESGYAWRSEGVAVIITVMWIGDCRLLTA